MLDYTLSLLLAVDNGNGIAEAFAGGSGWAGAGLLGLVLSWLLLKHLPEKDKLLLDLINAKDAQINLLAKEYKQALDVVVDHCKEEMEAHRKWVRFHPNNESEGG